MKAWGWVPMTAEDPTGGPDDNLPTAPPPPKDLRPCPSKHANGRTNNRWSREDRDMAHTSEHTVWILEKETHPCHPYRRHLCWETPNASQKRRNQPEGNPRARNTQKYRRTRSLQSLRTMKTCPCRTFASGQVWPGTRRIR